MLRARPLEDTIYATRDSAAGRVSKAFDAKQKRASQKGDTAFWNGLGPALSALLQSHMAL